MHRLFVAIRPPEAVRSQLLDLMEGVKGARWQDEDQLHLTLRFIGEVDRHLARDIAAALGSIHHPRFEIALSGLGTFERRGQPVTLWSGVSPHEPLKALHKKVDQAVLRAGVAPDRRAYNAAHHAGAAGALRRPDRRADGSVGRAVERSVPGRGVPSLRKRRHSPRRGLQRRGAVRARLRPLSSAGRNRSGDSRPARHSSSRARHGTSAGPRSRRR